MAQQEQLSEYWSKAMSGRFWLIASLFYVGVLLTNLAFVLGDGCGFAFIPDAWPLFLGMILGLLLFEWVVYRRYGANMTRRAGIGLLIAHVVLFEMTLAVDCTATTTFLYLLIPFMAYLFVNRWTAVFLAVLYSVWFATYFRVFRIDLWGDYIFRAVIFELSIVFSLAMASMVKGVLISQARERRLHTELQEAHYQLEAYAYRVKELGALEERNRLARDIHDSVGHYLAAVTVQLEKALAFRLNDPAKSEQAVRDARQAARDALSDVRHSVATLRQSAEFFSLTTALQNLIQQASNDELPISCQMNGDEAGYSKVALITLYRVVQEGLTNIQKHARAQKVQIRVSLGVETAVLTINDNGKGFNVAEQKAASSERHGLQGMRERLALVGGELRIESGDESGTSVTAVVPKQPPTLAKDLK